MPTLATRMNSVRRCGILKVTPAVVVVKRCDCCLAGTLNHFICHPGTKPAKVIVLENRNRGEPGQLSGEIRWSGHPINKTHLVVPVVQVSSVLDLNPTKREVKTVVSSSGQ